MKNYVCALDLGSSKFACSLGKLRKNGSVENLFLESVPAAGIRKGRIVDIQNASNSIGGLLKIIKEKSGVNVHYVSINIYGHDVSCVHSHTVIPLGEKRNKLITSLDLRRVTKEARLLGSRIEEEIIQMIPLNYSVDDRAGIANPVGLYGRKLGIDLFLISVKTSYLQNISRLLNRLGYEIKHIFLSGLATSRVILSKEALKHGLHVFCDIGADLTEMIIFKDGTLQYVETLSSGGNDLSEAVAKAFKIPFKLAEEIKQSYAYIAETDQIKKDKEVIIKKDDYYKVISQRKICEVVTNQAKSIYAAIKEKIDNASSKRGPVNKVFVCGRTILTDGFLEMMETTLGVPVKMAANPRLPASTGKRLKVASSIPQFLNYATALGLTYESADLSRENKILSLAASKGIILRVANRVRDTFHEYF